MKNLVLVKIFINFVEYILQGLYAFKEQLKSSTNLSDMSTNPRV